MAEGGIMLRNSDPPPGTDKPGEQSSVTLKRVLVADDHARILKAVSALLGKSFDVVDLVADGRAALQAALKLDPDLIVLDVSMPGMSGIEVARELKKTSQLGPRSFSSRFIRTLRFWRVVLPREGWATW